MNQKNHVGKTLKLVLILVVLGGMLVAFYYYVGNRMNEAKVQEEAIQVTKVQKVLQHNLDKNYPPTPKEVVKYFSEISQCFYNETYSEEELYELAMQIQKLYDKDLIANQTEEEYLKNLKLDIESLKKANYTISSYSPSSSTDVEYFEEEGREWAKLYCIYSLRQGSKRSATNEQFLLRKDEDGRWKIFGWKKTANQ